MWGNIGCEPGLNSCLQLALNDHWPLTTSEYSQEYDEFGRIKRKKKKYHDGESGSEYEFEYDSLGNLIGKKKIKEGKESRKHRIQSKFSC